jgi:hypothetical protein
VRDAENDLFPVSCYDSPLARIAHFKRSSLNHSGRQGVDGTLGGGDSPNSYQGPNQDFVTCVNNSLIKNLAGYSRKLVKLVNYYGVIRNILPSQLASKGNNS